MTLEDECRAAYERGYHCIFAVNLPYDIGSHQQTAYMGGVMMRRKLELQIRTIEADYVEARIQQENDKAEHRDGDRGGKVVEGRGGDCL